MREYQVRFCEGLGVKLPGSTRQNRPHRRGLLVRLFHELTFAITHTVRYTELAPIRFRNFWR